MQFPGLLVAEPELSVVSRIFCIPLGLFSNMTQQQKKGTQKNIQQLDHY